MAAHYIVIGNGIAGITAAETLRTEDPDSELTVIAEDPFPAYYRPALKDYLAGRLGEDKLWARPASFYQDHSIRFLHERVTTIGAGEHLVELQNGRQLSYHRLLLACGARAACLSCPGHDLQGVATLRSIADYQALRQRLAGVRRVVVSGSGTLALETIETLRQRGCRVTHLIRRRTLWSEVLDRTASDLVLQQERRDGVDLHLEEEIAAITGKQGQVNGVLTTSGAHIPCELVVIAIGIEPASEIARSAGIPCARGLLVDHAMRTAAPDIYAAGDILESADAASGRTRVIGQWYPALQQARAAAYSMLDLEHGQAFSASTFYNATFLYGLAFASVGLTHIPADTPGYQAIVADPLPRTYRKLILKDGIPVGVLAVGERRGTLALKRAIDYRVDLSPVLTQVFAEDFQLHAWLDRQGVPPVQAGVRLPPAHTRRETPAPAPAFLVPDARTGGHPGSQRPQKVLLNPSGATTIGRQVGVDLLLDHDSVSRRHAQISPVARHYVLRDLGSSNGTSVNGRPLRSGESTQLYAGDRLHFGTIPCLFESEQAAADTTPTRLTRHATGFYDPLAGGQLPASSAQPRLQADGSLWLPGAQQAIAPGVVATFESAAVLIALVRGHPRIFYLAEGNTLVLGRDRANAVALPDMSASRKHAEVFFSQDGYYLRDLGSSNGVQVNAATIEAPYRLAHGDRILIGGTPLYFLHQAAGKGAPGPQPGQRQRASRCPGCGSATPGHARFCAHCAAPLGQPVPAS
ncbi:MAG TPA: FAD-dependent oxidoreductase [Ktedonobacteraceae bacterium]|jgi:NADPH-dependent 2,4-dienoyl-CoA reductase/sulfur reductase-like enzyme/pSer/pThr/pTyr-binding forkhead associated (FHA) protein